ncbi:MAG TPA: hypothetical protein DF774_04910 [Rheinheimera sp.]|nr:hypothetical protein [Rheinheimera sp.]
MNLKKYAFLHSTAQLMAKVSILTAFVPQKTAQNSGCAEKSFFQLFINKKALSVNSSYLLPICKDNKTSA